MSILFNISVWLGRKFDIDGAPVCRVFNDKKTEHYTLQNDGMVIIQGVNSKVKDAMPINFCSEKLINKFKKSLKA